MVIQDGGRLTGPSTPTILLQCSPGNEKRGDARAGDRARTHGGGEGGNDQGEGRRNSSEIERAAPLRAPAKWL